MKKLVLLVAVLSAGFGVQAASAWAASGYVRVGSFAEQNPDGFTAIRHRRIAVNYATGDVYVADQQNARVSVYRPSGVGANLLTSLGTGDLVNPYGVAIDQGSGSVYVSDVAGVSKYDSDGSETPVFTRDASFGPITATGPLALDQSTDQLLVADTTTNRVRRYSAAGAPMSSFDGTAGAGSPGGFVGLQDLAVDSTGDIVVIDATSDPGAGGTSRIERFDAAGSWKSTIGPVDQAATVGIVPDNDQVLIGGNQDAVNTDESPTLTRFAADGTDLGPIALDGSLLCATISGIAIDDGNAGRLSVATDVSGGSYVGGYGLTSVQTYDLATLPVATAPVVTDVTKHGANVAATVDPTGVPTTWTFEYSSDGGSTWTAADSGDAGSGVGAVTVTATLSGLDSNAEYLVRVAATNAVVTVRSSPTTFTTDGDVPLVRSLAATRVTSTSARLNGLVNPNGGATTYWVEYGPTTAYGSTKPAAQDGDAGQGRSAIEVQQTVGGLAPGQSYHFRLVARNAVGTTTGYDVAFKTQSAPASAPDPCPNAKVREQQHASSLPDCRAYELVSPGMKSGNGVDPYAPVFISTDGDAAGIVGTSTPLPSDSTGTKQGYANTYRSSRSATGWTTRSVTPTVYSTNSSIGGIELGLYWSADMAKTVFSQGAFPIFRPPAPDGQGRSIALRDGIGGGLTWISRPTIADPLGEPSFYIAGISDRADHVIMNAVPVDASPVRLVASDAGRVSGPGVYDYVDGELRSVGILPDGTTPPEGARLASTDMGQNPFNADNSVSRDGRKIFFATTGGGAPNIYLRIDGSRTVLVSRSLLTDGPSTGAQFLYAAPDGSRAWFVASERLTEDAPASGGVYRFETSSGAVVYEPSLETTEPLASSEDGSRYVYLKDASQLWLHEDGTSRLIAEPVDLGSFYDSVVPDRAPVFSTPDGSGFLFLSSTEVEPGKFNNAGGFIQVYVYDAATHKLSCASCPPDGSPPSADAQINPDGVNFSQWRTPRPLSADGKRAFFYTRSQLVERDVNDNLDVYQWTPDGLSLLSAGTADIDAVFSDSSLDGRTVLIKTRDELTREDGDDNLDAYAVRVDGGFFDPGPRRPCDPAADTCQQPSIPQSAERSIVNGTPNDSDGASNVLRPRLSGATLTRRQQEALASGAAVSFAVGVTGPGKVSVTGAARVATKSRRVLSASRTAKQAGTVTLRIRLSVAARRQLRRDGRLPLVLTVRSTAVKAALVRSLVLRHKTTTSRAAVRRALATHGGVR